MSAQTERTETAQESRVTYRARGGLYSLVSPSSATGGAFTLWEAVNPPGTGVPPHIQRLEDEAFYILEGTYTFWSPEGSRECGPGDFVSAPKGTPHGLQNDGPGQARMLTLQVPGGIHEKYFAEAWEQVDDVTNLPPEPAPDFGKVKSAAERYGIEILPPR